MTLSEVIAAVKDQSLTKSDLESYYAHFLELYSKLELEAADLEKAEALYLDASQEETDAAKKRKWKATESGQRLILVKRYLNVAKAQMSAIKHRLFLVY